MGGVVKRHRLAFGSVLLLAVVLVPWLYSVDADAQVVANLRVVFGEMSMEGDLLYGEVSLISRDRAVDDLPLRLYATIVKPGQGRAAGEPRLVFEGTVEHVSTEEPVVVKFIVPIETDMRIFGLLMDAEFGLNVRSLGTGNQYFVVRL